MGEITIRNSLFLFINKMMQRFYAKSVLMNFFRPNSRTKEFLLD